ncbi:STAS domain-containing protein [Streptomyces sp. NPDC058295]|uniref:STAS domain-containing protein n=1 Tax=Streptomyces sp. NPDC058295 TaxID=3346431 RepID=UPI0036E33F0E
MTDIGKADRPKSLSVEHRVVDGVRVVTMQGEIDHDVKEVLGEALLSADGAVPPPRIVADLSGVTFMDSSGINVFLAAHRRTSGAQGWLRIAAAREPVLQVLRLVGVDALLSCHPTIEQALNP